MISLKPMILVDRLQKVKTELNEPYHFAHIGVVKQHWFGKKCFVWDIDSNKKVLALQSWNGEGYTEVDMSSLVWNKDGVEFDYMED